MPSLSLQLSNMYLDRKRPEFFHVDTERLMDVRHSTDPSKKTASGADDMEEVEQLQGQCSLGGGTLP